MSLLLRRLAAGVGVLLLTVVGLVLAPAASVAADTSPVCAPDSKSRVADVTETLHHLGDVGPDGHVWALTDVVVRIQVWQVGTSHFCIRRDLDGTFTSFAGVSPNLTGTISAGVNGTVHGFDGAVFTGKFVPRVPVSGDVGDFDVGCDQTGFCALHRSRVYLFFQDQVQALHVRSFDFVYDGGSHGTWHESDRASIGDITG